jgi:hypothetical protein
MPIKREYGCLPENHFLLSNDVIIITLYVSLGKIIKPFFCFYEKNDAKVAEILYLLILKAKCVKRNMMRYRNGCVYAALTPRY